MSGAFQYKPKFRDMRIRPPVEGEDEAANDVNSLKPGEIRCDWPECRHPGAAKAPKSREAPGDHYWFCTRHASEYNKNWNYFAGMGEAEVERTVTEERQTGGRPTWSFKASNRSREAAAQASKGTFFDAFGLFGTQQQVGAADAKVDTRVVGKIERKALSDLDLDAGASPEVVRAKYTELLKRLHPDSNGGDRSMEDKLNRVIKAYKSLKAAKLA